MTKAAEILKRKVTALLLKSAKVSADLKKILKGKANLKRAQSIWSDAKVKKVLIVIRSSPGFKFKLKTKIIKENPKNVKKPMFGPAKPRNMPPPETKPRQRYGPEKPPKPATTKPSTSKEDDFERAYWEQKQKDGEKDRRKKLLECKPVLCKNKITNKKSFRQYSLKNHPDKNPNATDEDKRNFVDANTCWGQWTNEYSDNANVDC